MKRIAPIKLKAAFLLLVFALNTVVGFACSMGVNMGFNKHHHDEPTVHIHADGKVHHHKQKKQHSHNHGKENCCNDSVVKFQQVDKNLAPGAPAIPGAAMMAALLSPIFSIDIFATSQIAHSPRVIPYYHPPPPDIRVFIQSFQI
ncbi:MAG TPA: hypothetical protein VLD19_21135 [Chitinophagaceae bacterium]|nr:hypothetical protein [Chitinophagaceae bacterium]